MGVKEAARTRCHSAAVAAIRYTNDVLSLGPVNSLSGAIEDVATEWILGEPSNARDRLNTSRANYPRIPPGGSYFLSLLDFPALLPEIGNAQTGCCGEFSIVAFEFLKEKSFGGSLFPVEFVQAPNHWLVVVNRNASSDIKNPATWGTETYVCDAWNNRVVGKEFFGQPNWRYKPNGDVCLRLPGSMLQGFLVRDWNGW